MISRERCSHFESELELILRQLIDERVDSEGSLIVSIDAVVHNKELAVWRINYESSHCFKVSQVHAFVKVTVIKNNRSRVTLSDS